MAGRFMHPWRWVTWETENLWHRPLRWRDLPGVYACLQDPALVRYMFTTKAIRGFAIVAFGIKTKWKLFRGTGIYYVAVMKSTKKVVSLQAVTGLDPRKPHSGELGSWWIQELWGSAIRAEEGVGIWHTFLYEEVGLYRLFYKTDAENVRAARAVKRSNFRFEARLREAHGKSEECVSFLQWSQSRTSPSVENHIAWVKQQYGWPPRPEVTVLPDALRRR